MYTVKYRPVRRINDPIDRAVWCWNNVTSNSAIRLSAVQILLQSDAIIPTEAKELQCMCYMQSALQLYDNNRLNNMNLMLDNILIHWANDGSCRLLKLMYKIYKTSRAVYDADISDWNELKALANGLDVGCEFVRTELRKASEYIIVRKYYPGIIVRFANLYHPINQSFWNQNN